MTRVSEENLSGDTALNATISNATCHMFVILVIMIKVMPICELLLDMGILILGDIC